MCSNYLRAKLRDCRKGLSLAELMVAVFIIGVGIMSGIAAFQLSSTSLHRSKSITLANMLGEDQMEQLKELTYFQVLVTTAIYTDNRFSPALVYDTGNYSPQTVIEGGMTFMRTTRVDFAYRYNNAVSTVIWTTEDTGLKLITVNVSWKDGKIWRTQTLQNVISNPIYNPMNARFQGTVYKQTGGHLSGALIQVLENGSWFTFSQSGGAYAFSVSPGTYTLQCSYLGYYTSTTTGYLQIGNDQIVTQDFTLSPIATGTMVGYVYDFNNVVLSQVVASTDDATGAEYIELYNPLPNSVNIKNNIDLTYWDNTNSSTTIALTYISTYMPTNTYYLIANTPVVRAGGVSRNADATYSTITAPNHLLSTATAQGVSINDHGNGTQWDSLAWHGVGTAPASATEGAAITPLSGEGLADGEQFVRMTDPGNVNPLYGNSYDSNNNNTNFRDNYLTPFTPPHDRNSTPQVPIAGVPAVNAQINSTDPLSSTVRSISTVTAAGYHVASFSIPSIATGTWSMEAYLNAFGRPNFTRIDNIVVQASVSTGVPNAGSVPAWIVPGSTNTLLTATTNYALIAGHAYDAYGNPLAGIKMYFNGLQTFTGADGSYFMAVPPATNIPLYANYNYNNPAYTLGVLYLTVVAGAVYDPEDITIYLGGVLQGYYQTPAGQPLSGRAAVAVFGVGNQYSQAVSDQSGNFYLRNITTGTYTITPALDSSEIATPPSIAGILTSTGAPTFVSTFTIINALGQISGQVLKGTLPITTGVLVMASTNTIGSLPPPQSGNAGPLCNPCYYGNISDGSGKYSLSVRSSPNAYNVYGWYTSGLVTTQQVFTVTVSTGQIISRNLTW